MANLQFKVFYKQPLEIQIEFPMAVLASYYGSSNLDRTWDDNILPLITRALHSHQVYIKTATLTFSLAPGETTEKLSYYLLLVVKPPLFDFNWIINPLARAGFQRGLHLKAAAKGGGFKSY